MKFSKPLRVACASVLLGAVLVGQAMAADTLQGKVLEVQNTDSYTYLLLKVAGKDTWVAVQLSKVKVGASVTVENPMEMKNFESKALKKTFPSIVFGNLQEAAGDMAKPHAASAPAADVLDVKVAKSGAANGRTVAEVIAGASALGNKAVEIHAKVVKVNGGIMGKNWVHLRDGSGKAEDGSNDILVTTLAENTAVGSTVTVTGTVRTNKDFGSGYAYKVMLEDASFKP
jgi:hypothetical protein